MTQEEGAIIASCLWCGKAIRAGQNTREDPDGYTYHMGCATDSTTAKHAPSVCRTCGHEILFHDVRYDVNQKPHHASCLKAQTPDVVRPEESAKEVRPSYYRTRIKVCEYADGYATIECFDLIDALHLPFYAANALKYIFRRGTKTKETVEDMRKASTYCTQSAERER